MIVNINLNKDLQKLFLDLAKKLFPFWRECLWKISGKLLIKKRKIIIEVQATQILKAKMKALAENLVKLKTYCLARKRVHTLATFQRIVTETS
jgi:hypothetical protein